MNLQKFPHSLLQFLPFHHTIDDSLFHQEFRSLEPLRQLLSDRLCDHSRSGKSDQCPRFCQDHISKHRKTCRHPAGGRIGQYRKIKKTCFTVFPDRRRGFCHLHQRYDSLLHPGTTGTGKQYHRQFFFRRPFKSSRNFFTYDIPHASHQETGIADTKYCLQTIHHAFSHSNCFMKFCLLLQICNLFFISRIFQRIFRFQIGKPLLKCSRVCNHADPGSGSDPEISLALRAYISMCFYIIPVYYFSAFRTLKPQSFRCRWLFFFLIPVFSVPEQNCRLFKHMF